MAEEQTIDRPIDVLEAVKKFVTRPLFELLPVQWGDVEAHIKSQNFPMKCPEMDVIAKLCFELELRDRKIEQREREIERLRAGIDKDEKRFQWLSGGVDGEPVFDGLGGSDRDIYEIACDVAAENTPEIDGRDPTAAEMATAMRRLIDLAASKESSNA